MGRGHPLCLWGKELVHASLEKENWKEGGLSEGQPQSRHSLSYIRSLLEAQIVASRLTQVLGRRRWRRVQPSDIAKQLCHLQVHTQKPMKRVTKKSDREKKITKCFESFFYFVLGHIQSCPQPRETRCGPSLATGRKQRPARCRSLRTEVCSSDWVPVLATKGEP